MLSIEILLKTYNALIFVNYIVHTTVCVHLVMFSLITFIHNLDSIYYGCIR